MLRTEYVDNNTRIRHWSDMGMQLRQNETGILYEDAVDYLPCAYTYTETDIPIEDWEEPETMVSSKNIPNGEFFAVGSNLYYSTATIAAGDEIETGVNCEAVELADALNELKED